ncbi:TIGR04255 family protein [Cryptosporangium sp. NPDC048952]|uniref:TIGR04255 family protein n=1 Tax=Cryptosporangium sp. NPDC048952 TaxID=3363961 RepID=UPI00371A1A7E
MGTREIYTNPPLALTVVELRHPTSVPLHDADQAALKTLLNNSFPIFKPARQVIWAVTMPPASESPEQTQTIIPRYMNRDRTAAITFRAEAIAIETTSYQRRSVLREILREAVQARQKVAPVDGVERLGIRYINEVRAPVDSPADWAQWIAPALAGMTGLGGNHGGVQTWQGMASFGTPLTGTVVRHGNFEGHAVDPSGDLRRASTPPPGPFYLMDLDSYWTPEDNTPPLDWELVEPRFNEAALCAYDLFQDLITDRYRLEVLDRAQ